MDDRGTFLHGLFGIEDTREFLVIDLDQLARLFGVSSSIAATAATPS